MDLHPIPPGLWCVPSALVAITGADFASVIHPALNRHARNDTLTGVVTASTMAAARATLVELGYKVRPYKHAKLGTVATWAKRSVELYPGRVLMLAVPQHVVIIKDGRVYDSWTPHGAPGATHPYTKDRVHNVWLVER
jgi:hypothetical protein